MSEKQSLRPVAATAGVFFFILGCLGAALPLLPATPFFLLAAFFLLRASPALFDRLTRIPFFGPALRRATALRGLTMRAKLIVFVIALAFLLPIIITHDSRALRFSLTGVLVLKALVLARMRTLPRS